ncbi:hypothetical protein LAZ67_5002557 [Cordylochernes scorpioides]|uniref:Transposase Tc1-like domain-containing protein n=1 Tax=Cordylochernes scorpioides TaxID=51811 RepID=A0ABY6KHN0_9ARAC|nr:hypothetical protein LAZ67_5002557 [Cordylochernes scorpioides]
MSGHRKRRQFKQTDAFTRGMVIGLKRAGWSIRQIAADTHLGASTVHRLWRRWLEQGNVAIYRNVGATRVTSARVDRRILRQAVAAPQATCTAILQHVQDTLDHSISTRTISRRLVANGLHSCRPLRRLPLTPPNRRQRLEWCRARSTWMTEWHRVVFSDESRFCLSSDSRRVRVWRRRGERSNPAAIVERPTVCDNVESWFGAQSRMIPDASWPPYSPELSPIDHVWDIIGRRLHALPQPRSEDELWQMVEREWRAIPQDAIRTLIESLPRRVAACIAVRVMRPLLVLAAVLATARALNLTVLHTNDVHSRFEEFNAFGGRCPPSDRGRCYGGVARQFTKNRDSQTANNEVSSATGTMISSQTLYRGLNERGMYARRPKVSTETFDMLNKAFPNDAPKRTTIFEWHSRFKTGRSSIEDDPHQGLPKFQRTNENVQTITDLIKENLRTTLLDLEQDTGISKTTIGRIEMTRTDPEWKDKIITGDETRVYGYDPVNQASICRVERSGPKVIKEMYLGIHRRLRKAIRKKKCLENGLMVMDPTP